jgi:hypothetical protein
MAKHCNPCQLEIFEFTQYTRSSESLSVRQIQKKECIQIRMTSYSRGPTKNSFIDDCQKRVLTEAEVLRQIVKLHYDLIRNFPHLEGKEFKEIYAFLTQKPQ